MATLRDIGVSAVVNVGLTILFLLAFLLLSLQPINDKVYHPKLYLKGMRKRRPRANPRQLKPMEKYFNLEIGQYTRVFEWANSALRKSEDYIIDHAGLDSAVFLRIFLVGLKVFVPMMVLGMVILIPVNVGAGSLSDQGTTSRVTGNATSTKFLFSSIDKLSMSNVPNGSPRLWSHLVMSYVFTAWVCFILFVEYKSIAAMRLKFLSDEKRRPDQFTVMVLQVPDKGREPLSTQVENYFRMNHPDYYLTHQMAYNADKLSRIVRKRDTAQNWLVYFQLKHSRNPNIRPTIKTGFCGLFGAPVDALDYYTAQIEQLTKELRISYKLIDPYFQEDLELMKTAVPLVNAEDERAVVIKDPNATMPAAFVSFKTRWGAAVCAQTQQNQDPTLWLTDWAPEPRDVYWANLSIPYLQLGFRRLATIVIVFLLVFFYMIPVAAVQSLANLEGLRRSIPALDGLLRRGFVASFVQGFLPGLILKICFWILPKIIMFVSKFEGHLAVSKLERRSAAKYYYFMVVNVFFGSILAGSAFQQLKTFVTSSSFLGFLDTLADSIPQKGTFFITYIMVDGWSGPAGEILRLWPLIMYHIRNFLFCKTERDRLQATSPGTMSLDQTLPQLQLYFLMGLVYSVITPVIIPFIVIFMGFAFVVYRYQVINVYDPVYESAGAFWPHVHGRIIAALLLEHLTLIGLFLAKGPISFVHTNSGGGIKSKVLRYVGESCSSTPFMIALPIITIFFHNYCKKRFESAFKNYPLDNAMEKDMVEKEREPDFNLAVFLRNAYKHPDFSDEKDNGAPDLEKGPQGDEGEEDEKAVLQDSLPLREEEEEFIELDDDDIEAEEEEGLVSSPPLTFRWGAFHQSARPDDVTVVDSVTSSNESVKDSLSREPSDLGPPLRFRRGWFYDDLGEESAGSFKRRFSDLSNLESVSESPLTFRRGTFYQEDDSEESGRGSWRKFHSARSFFEAGSSRSTFDPGSEVSETESPDSPFLLPGGGEATEDQLSGSELARLQSLQRYLQGQLSRENSFFESPNREETARLAAFQSYLRNQMSRESSFAIRDDEAAAGVALLQSGSNPHLSRDNSLAESSSSNTETLDDEETARVAEMRRYLKGQLSRENSEIGEDGIDEEALRLVYLQGYLRGQLSRENSFCGSPGSPRQVKPIAESPSSTSRKGNGHYQGDDDVAQLREYLRGQLSRENSGSESPGSPLTFRWGSFNGGGGEEDRNGGGASPSSFTDSPIGSPLIFTTGRFYQANGDANDQRGGRVHSTPSQTLPRNRNFNRASTMSTIRETSEMNSDMQRGHFSRARSFGIAAGGSSQFRSPGSPLSREGKALQAETSEPEIVPEPAIIEVPISESPALSRAKSLGTLREVIYLESPSFVRPNLSRARTLGALLREPQDAGNARSPSPQGGHQISEKRKSVQTRTTPPLGMGASSSRPSRVFSRPKTVTDNQIVKEAPGSSGASTSRPANTLGSLLKEEPQVAALSSTLQLRRQDWSAERVVDDKEDDHDDVHKKKKSSSSSSSSTSSSSSSSSSSSQTPPHHSAEESEKGDDVNDSGSSSASPARDQSTSRQTASPNPELESESSPLMIPTREEDH